MSGEASKATIVLVTAEGCNACDLFGGEPGDQLSAKNQLVEALSEIEDVSIVEIHFAGMTPEKIAHETNHYHLQLHKFVRWFPSIIMFNHTFDEEANLEGLIYASKNINGRIMPVGGADMLTPELVTDWVHNELNNEPLFA